MKRIIGELVVNWAINWMCFQSLRHQNLQQRTNLLDNDNFLWGFNLFYR